MARPILMYQGSEGEHIVPLKISFGWGGLGSQFFLEMTCLGVIYHIQNDSGSLDAQNPPKKFLTFETFARQRGV